jgi:hypothetical protein
MVSGKKRLYIALFFNGVSNNEEKKYVAWRENPSDVRANEIPDTTGHSW